MTFALRLPQRRGIFRLSILLVKFRFRASRFGIRCFATPVSDRGAPADLLFKIESQGLGTRPDPHHYVDTKEIVMPVGTVKFFNTQKGFGFIAPEGGATDVFVHATAVERAGLGTIVEGQKLQFEVVTDRRTGRSSADNLQAV
jgi:cold shock protein